MLARHGCRTMLRDEAAKDPRKISVFREEWPFQDERILINHHMYPVSCLYILFLVDMLVSFITWRLDEQEAICGKRGFEEIQDRWNSPIAHPICTTTGSYMVSQPVLDGLNKKSDITSYKSISASKICILHFGFAKLILSNYILKGDECKRSISSASETLHPSNAFDQGEIYSMFVKQQQT